MPRHRSDSDGGTFSGTHAQVELGAVTMSPAALSMMCADGVGRFDERPPQVLIAFCSHLAVVSLAAGGTDARGGTTVAGELLSRGETADGAEFTLDDNCQHIADAGQRLEQLRGGSEGNLGADAILKLADLQGKVVE